MFLTAKFTAFMTQPVAWSMILLTLAVLSWRVSVRWGKRLGVAGVVLLVVAGWEYPPSLVTQWLENRYEGLAETATLGRYEGVIVLGGAFESSSKWKRPGRIALNAAAERMIVPVGLLRQHPHLKLLFTGGSAELFDTGLTEAARAKRVFDLLGVDSARVIYEDQSRTTYENAVYSAKLAGVDIKRPWLLLTSAAHMPRSMGAFQKAGWNVTAYPVDYRTAAQLDWWGFSYFYATPQWQDALHETIGYAMYWLTGRI
jgi:uncharacterized SAM-binding protein YcdF (DUF218 family)